MLAERRAQGDFSLAAQRHHDHARQCERLHGQPFLLAGNDDADLAAFAMHRHQAARRERGAGLALQFELDPSQRFGDEGATPQRIFTIVHGRKQRQ